MTRRARRLLGERPVPIAAAVPASLLATASLIVVITGTFPGDEWVLRQVIEVFGTELDTSMGAVGRATDTLPIVLFWAIVGAVVGRRSGVRAAMSFAIFVTIAMAGNRLLKELVQRPRPELRTLPEAVSTWSFPSGHVTNTLAGIAALLLILPAGGRSRPITRVVGGAAVVVVAFSRVVLGVHFPSDVGASALWVATLWLLASPIVAEEVKDPS